MGSGGWADMSGLSCTALPRRGQLELDRPAGRGGGGAGGFGELREVDLGPLGLGAGGVILDQVLEVVGGRAGLVSAEVVVGVLVDLAGEGGVDAVDDGGDVLLAGEVGVVGGELFERRAGVDH